MMQGNRRDFFTLVTIAIIAFLVPLSARAQAAPVNVCAAFTDAGATSYFASLRGRMTLNLPASYGPVIGAIDIRENDDPTLIGPRVVQGERLSLEVPSTFLHDQCLFVALQERLMERPPLLAALRLALARCKAADAPIMPCFRVIAEALIATVDEDRADEQGKQKAGQYAAARRAFVTDAANFLVAHEVRHLVDRSSLNQDRLAKRDEEFDADLFAQIVTTSERPVHPGVLMAMATASIVDDYRPHDSMHDPDACRIARVSKVFELSALPMLDIITARLGLVVQLSTKEDMVAEMLRLAKFDLVQGAAAPSCDVSPTKAVRDYIADLTSIRGILHGPSGRDDGHLLPVISSLLTHRYKSQFGRMVSLSAATALYMTLEESKPLLTTPEWPRRTGKESVGYLQLSAAIWRLADGEPARDVRLPELSALILVRALVEVANAPAGSKTRLVFDHYSAEFDRAVALFDATTHLSEIQTGIAGKMLGAELNFRDNLLVNAYLTKISSQFVAGKCDDAAHYAERLSVIWKEDMSAMVRADESKICQQFQDATWAYSRKLGWVD